MPNYPPVNGMDGPPLPFVRAGSAWTRTVSFFPKPFSGLLTNSWTLNSAGGTTIPQLAGSAGGNIQFVDIPDACLHDLAVLSSVTMYISPANHVSITGLAFPKFNVFRYVLASASSGGTGLNSGGPASLPNPGSAGAYSNPNQSWTFTPNQNNVIDKSLYNYAIVITDESGSNTVVGNLFTGILMSYTLNSTLGNVGVGFLWFA